LDTTEEERDRTVSDENSQTEESGKRDEPRLKSGGRERNVRVKAVNGVDASE